MFVKAAALTIEIPLVDTLGDPITSGTVTTEILKDSTGTYAATSASAAHVDEELWTLALTTSETNCDRFRVRVTHADLAADVIVSDDAWPTVDANIVSVDDIAVELVTITDVTLDIGTVSLTPTSSTLSTGEVSGDNLVGYQHAEQTFVFTVTDDDGDVVDLDGKSVSFIAHDPADPTTAAVTRAGVVSGDDSNIVTVGILHTDTATACRYAYRLWNTTDKQILASGVWHVHPNPASA